MTNSPRNNTSNIFLPGMQKKTTIDQYFSKKSSYWNKIYQRDDVEAIIYQQRCSIALKYINELCLPTDAKILEVGCGAGLTTVELARSGYSVVSLDSVKEMRDLTRQRARAAGVAERVKIIHGDVHELTYPPASFNLVIALGVIPWLANVKQALSEIVRVLTPGGHLIISADNRNRLNYFFDPTRMPMLTGIKKTLLQMLEKTGLRKKPKVPGANMHKTSEMNRILASAGMEKIKHQTIGFGPFYFYKYPLLPNSIQLKIHHLLQHHADRGFPILRSTGSQYLVLARKL